MAECAICLVNEIVESERCVNNCGHSFCKACIDTWFDRGHNSCPLCRQLINYFKHNEDHYRVIVKHVITPRTVPPLNVPQEDGPVNEPRQNGLVNEPPQRQLGYRLQGRLVTVNRSTLSFFQYAGVGILCMLFLQSYMLVTAKEKYNSLSTNYDTCMSNNSDLTDYVLNDGQIDVPQGDVFVYNKHIDEYVKCYIPYYYIHKCFS